MPEQRSGAVGARAPAGRSSSVGLVIESKHGRFDQESPLTEKPQPQRDVLPVPDITPVGLTTYDAKDPDAAFPPIEPLRPPEGAPNVLIVLIDDVGFGASSAFGGPISTPNAERLAATGLKYNRFHTTALCSPRALRC